jgi:hypothetical protein
MEGKMTDWPRAKPTDLQCKEKLTTGRRCTGTCVDPITRKAKGANGEPVRGGYCIAYYRREDKALETERAQQQAAYDLRRAVLAERVLCAVEESGSAECLVILRQAKEGAVE